MAFGDHKSREFKVMLDDTKFGKHKELSGKAIDFWADRERKAERVVEFIDTKSGQTRSRDPALCRRRQLGEAETRMTLKRRRSEWVLVFHTGTSWGRGLTKSTPGPGGTR